MKKYLINKLQYHQIQTKFYLYEIMKHIDTPEI